MAKSRKYSRKGSKKVSRKRSPIKRKSHSRKTSPKSRKLYKKHSRKGSHYRMMRDYGFIKQD
jgi:hypothetical protein